MNNLGTIEEGKVANLLLVDDNLLMELDALQDPSTGFVKGRRLDRTLLDSFEDKAMTRKNLLATALRYAENLSVEK
jgi:hypothetical protein